MKKNNLIMSRLHSLGVAIMASCLLLSCGGDSGGGSSSGSSENPLGKVSSTAFWVDFMDNNEWQYFLHKTGDPTASCVIAADSVTNEDLECTAHVPEGSIYVHDASLQVNVPKGMCRSLRMKKYWYYNFRPGIGPTEVSIKVDTDSTTDAKTYNCDEDATPDQDCENESLYTEVYFDGEAPVETCIYNHKAKNADHPNCCYGSYTLTTETWTDGFRDDTATTKKSWGEKLDEKCFGGPAARDSKWPKTDLGNPVNRVVSVWEEGYNAEFTTFSPLSIVNEYPATVSQANYFTASSHAGEVPMAILGGDNIGITGKGEDLSDDPVIPGQATHDFECMDEAFEPIQRIRITIQEWNTYSEWLSYVSDPTGAGATADPDVTGAQDLTGCEYSVDPTGPCNDFSDWDDLVGIFPEEY